MSAPPTELTPAPPAAPQRFRTGSPSGNNLPPARRQSTRVPLVVLLILSLVGAGAVRQWADDKRGQTVHVGETSSATPLSRMDSFALALLLGGLRGPLVMILWTSSESQKQEKDLDDFDTKVEWIRLLQPEFDTVHIFQIWNKAYNISVLKASLANKYLTILDALDYADKVDSERPDDINIVYAIGGVYFDKLDQSQEKDYYRERVRTETLPHPPAQKLSRDDPAWRRLELDPILDSNGYLLPQYLKPTSTLLVDPNDPTQRYDGSKLQFLAAYQPYPDGVPPAALGYNYQLRAAMLQRTGHQRHAQLSDMVIDSRPALTQKFWSEEELEHGRRLELAALGKPIPSERLDMEQPAAGTPFDQPLTASQRTALEHARSVYALSSKLATDSLSAFEQHLIQFKSNINTDRSHMDTLRANIDLAAGDRDYLAAMLADPSARAPLLAAAREEYRRSLIAQDLIIFHYYLSDETARAVFPRGYDRNTIGLANPDLFGPIVEEVKRRTYLPGQYAENKDDIDESLRYIGRIETRLALLGK
jgi:hypothetical protein